MEKLLKLDAHFKRVTIITLLAIICMAGICAYTIYTNSKNIKEFNKRIYVVNKNKQFEAIAANINENRPVEIQYHVARFHELFFTVIPDAGGIEDNIKKSFYLCDESAKKLYDDLKEQNFFNDMIQGNVVQKVIIDSVQTDTSLEPYFAKCFARVIQTRSSSTTEKKLISTCELEDIARSINCPNGLLMRNFKVIETAVIR